MSDVERVAEAMYYHQTDNHPTMHCNRFPLWSEISDEKQQNIRDMATAAIAAIVPEGSVVVPRERIERHKRDMARMQDHADRQADVIVELRRAAIIKASEDTV